MIFVLVDYAYDFEFREFLVITQKMHVYWVGFMFIPGIQVCLRMQCVKFQILIFDLGALKNVFMRMAEIIRLTFDPRIRCWENESTT